VEKMIVQKCIDYNKKQLRKWHEAVEKWKEERHPHNIIPQIAFYCFWNNRGEERKDGWVAEWENGAFWGRTRQEAIQKAVKWYK